MELMKAFWKSERKNEQKPWNKEILQLIKIKDNFIKIIKIENRGGGKNV